MSGAAATTASGAISSSSLPTTSGSLVTASTTVSARTALSEEYDVRRQAASTVRVKARTPSTGTSATGLGASSPGGVASSGAGPPRSRHCAKSATASSSDGTCGWSGTSDESAARISIRCSGEARVFLVGDHQQTTWDCARVRATYNRRSHSPASSSWARRTWSAHPAPPAPTLRQRRPASSWKRGRSGSATWRSETAGR